MDGEARIVDRMAMRLEVGERAVGRWPAARMRLLSAARDAILWVSFTEEGRCGIGSMRKGKRERKRSWDEVSINANDRSSRIKLWKS